MEERGEGGGGGERGGRRKERKWCEGKGEGGKRAKKE